MCGIFGIVNSNNKPIVKKDLDLLSINMVHRGPDDDGLFIHGDCGIGMRRLSIIDLDTGHQPMSSGDKSVQLVFNGEIYNYKELSKIVISKGYSLRTKSDVEVLIYLYQEYGKECVKFINGMFSFALYDLRNKTIWIVRDRLGIKPLYYFKNEKFFCFSSELSGIAKLIQAKLSYSSIINYLGFSYIEAPNTIYENIFKLMPGEEINLDINNYQLKKNIYWKLDKFENNNNDISLLTEELNSLISDSIKIQMRSDVPVGMFLSGGIDSSAISTYASKLLNDKINTFTINFKDKPSEDHRYARIISENINSNHFEIEATASSQISSLDELINYMDEPMSDSAIVPTFMIAKAAKNQGMKVMLSGAGADEIFGGYERHFPGKVGSASWLSNLPSIYKKIILPLLSLKNSSYKYRFANSARNFATNISGINYTFLKEIFRKENSFTNLLAGIDNSLKLNDPNNSYDLMHLDVKNYLPNNILMLTDQATMAASIEGRVPFLDHRIVEFAFSIQRNINLLNGESKGLLKKTLHNTLPNELLNRKKEGFNAPVHLWIDNWPMLIKNELIENMSPFLLELIDKSAIINWLDNEVSRKKSANSLYALYILNMWLRKKHYSNLKK